MVYTNMPIEEYPPYKELDLPIGLFGPAPFNPPQCVCGNFIIDGNCICSSTPPSDYKVQQDTMYMWFNRFYHWRNQLDEFNSYIYKASAHVRLQLLKLIDAESPIGCYTCHISQYSECQCDCPDCGDKYCNGSCYY
jgi:hypothetical protein